MCDGCKWTANNEQELRQRGHDVVTRHPCDYPHTCTCQHNRMLPVKPERSAV